MKRYIIVLAMLLASVSCIFSQNAFSDAISLSSNGQSFIEIIEKLQTVKKMTDRQRNDFDNLKIFLKDPWNTEIGEINFKIMLEIPSIVLGIEIDVNTIELNIKKSKEDLKVMKDKLIDLQTLLGIINAELDSEGNILDSTNRKRFQDSLKTISDGISSYNRSISDKETEIRTQDSIKGNMEYLKAIQSRFNDIKYEMKEGNSPISMLGENNEQEVKQTVSNANFSLSQAAIIDAIGNAIVEQVKEGLLNSLFEGIFALHPLFRTNFNLS
jgi:hypothetical protein